MASIPDRAYYYDPYFGACEPCFSRLPGNPGNACVYTDMSGPDSPDWIVDDDDVMPPDARGCATGEKFDLMLMQCRARCPGEDEKNGQQFVYAPDNKSGTCDCYNPSQFSWDASLNQCVPIQAPPMAMRARSMQAAQPGDPYNACALDVGEYTNCYFPDSNTCFDAVFGEQDAIYGAAPSSLSAALKQRSLHEACPYLLCPSGATSVNKQGVVSAQRSACVCVSKKMGERVVTAGHKKGKKKGV